MLHDSEIHLGNILLQSSDLSGLSARELYAQHGRPSSVSTAMVAPWPFGAASLPKRQYLPPWLGKKSDELTISEARLLLTDFGSAFHPEEQRGPVPRGLAPYSFFRSQQSDARFRFSGPFSFASDV